MLMGEKEASGVLAEGTGSGIPKEPAWPDHLSDFICVSELPLTTSHFPSVSVTRSHLQKVGGVPCCPWWGVLGEHRRSLLFLSLFFDFFPVSHCSSVEAFCTISSRHIRVIKHHET